MTNAAPAPLNNDDALIAWAATQTWSSFAVDVAAKARRFGLSVGQRAALESMKAKCEAKQPKTEAALQTAKASGVAGFDTAVAMLDHIDASGNKWPKIFLSLKEDAGDAEDRRLKLYRYQSGGNVGAVGMKLGDNWLGNVGRDGVWAPTLKARTLDPETKAKVWNVLKSLRDEPVALFARNGKLLGTCACCGRPLSNDESVAIGIGPECRAKLGGMF